MLQFGRCWAKLGCRSDVLIWVLDVINVYLVSFAHELGFIEVPFLKITKFVFSFNYSYWLFSTFESMISRMPFFMLGLKNFQTWCFLILSYWKYIIVPNVMTHNIHVLLLYFLILRLLLECSSFFSFLILCITLQLVHKGTEFDNMLWYLV